MYLKQQICNNIKTRCKNIISLRPKYKKQEDLEKISKGSFEVIINILINDINSKYIEEYLREKRERRENRDNNDNLRYLDIFDKKENNSLYDKLLDENPIENTIKDYFTTFNFLKKLNLSQLNSLDEKIAFYKYIIYIFSMLF